MTTRSFVKFSTVRPGTRHGAVIDVGADKPALASGKFNPLSPSLFALTLATGETSILAVVHGSLCTESRAPQGALNALVPDTSVQPKRFARYGAIKASTRYLKNIEVQDSDFHAGGAFRFVEPGTLELTFPDGSVNLVLVARGYLYAEEKPPVDALTGLIGATIGTADEEAAAETESASK